MSNFLARRALSFIKIASSPWPSVGVSTVAGSPTVKHPVHASVDDETQKPNGHYHKMDFGTPPLFPKRNGTQLGSKCNVEVVDNDAWRLSSGLAAAWRESTNRLSATEESTHNARRNLSNAETEPEIYDVEDMRIQGKLFYKLEKDSKEFEEYHYEFHGKASKKKKHGGNHDPKEHKTVPKTAPFVEKQSQITKFHQKPLHLDLHNVKRIRTPTFNQLTGPYHEPFCLDIFISKGSVRACIVHRASSKVVAVAHSISKDIKFDIGSTRDAKACGTVGRLLAQRAMEDDIHDVIYTPRKGEKLEGKLLLVLQTVIDNGVNVKLKIKQRKPKKVLKHPH